MKPTHPTQGLWEGQLHRFEHLDSTNSWALTHAAVLHEGDIVVAETQSQGRGRFDRFWLAVPGRSLTFSLFLKNKEWIALAANLGQAAAVAVLRLLQRYQIPGQLKWPNDVMIHNCKMAGILVERAEEGYVVGIGLNVNITEAELKKVSAVRPASSMAMVIGHDLDCEEVLTGLLENLSQCLTTIRRQGMQPLWREWSCHDWLMGRSVRLCGLDGEMTVGEYLGVSLEGGLRLRTLEGYEKVFWSGDVERVITT